tara:strand:- start:377 stop:853 length:477 start_codon:yes stop_codon:yes gene_type:complete
MTKKFTHFDDSGNPNMVDINDKKDTKRLAIAVGKVVMQKETLKLINKNKIKKGDVFQVANLAGIQGAKKTDNLIPLCHSLPLSYVKITFSSDEKNNCVNIKAEASLIGKTGVEMEALTAVSISALTIYDMCKSVDKTMKIDSVKLIHKSGGKTGIFNA